MSDSVIHQPSAKIGFGNVMQAVADLFSAIGAAQRIAHAIDEHRRPQTEDLAIIGLDPKRFDVRF